LLFLFLQNHVSLFTPGVRRALSDPELFTSEGKVRPLQHQCVERLLLNWNVLIAYFNIVVFEDNLNSAQTILDCL